MEPPAAIYEDPTWESSIPFEATSLNTTSTLPFAPYPIENPALWQASEMWAGWEIQNYQTLSSTHDNTFETLEFESPSRALSVGSKHLSMGSGGSSNYSWSSSRGRSRIKKVFSRSSSIASRAKSAMKEGMSSWSLSGAKQHVSPSPGRTGKLADIVREGIRMLKGQGACWKCKILKKSCDPCSPCKECASSTKAAWQKIGCQRGALGASYKPVKLCPSADPCQADSEAYLSEEDWVAKQAEANRLWEEEMRTRCAEMGTTRLMVYQKNYSPHFPQEQLPVLFLRGLALKQQVVKAMKELAPNLDEPKRKQEVFMLLYHASLYEECLNEQTSHTSHLILLSIRCLNHSLDAVRTPPSLATLHHACKPERCGLHPIAKLQQSSSRYIDGLHDVTFGKWGLSNHRYWWLAIYYSLCIQGLVRENLIKLSERVRSSHQNLDRYSNAKLYLHSFITLFEAASAEYDPITTEYELSPGEMSQIILARIAVNPWHWEGNGIHSSYDHLRCIFEVEQKVDRCGEE
ncbi:hypothetical protein OIDMADRAFT_57835 [Oidiodendron maius Zn]|uniref:Uncharacterized protein n=1 Tax=Oidiodendron maius (strain Zn) TaxID=913774 RepID=A0A0C3GM58_OIDMZ|nr:hypothetical protein OIDMADRAFT_57835 [Oidiodendron maius Zn]